MHTGRNYFCCVFMRMTFWQNALRVGVQSFNNVRTASVLSKNHTVTPVILYLWYSHQHLPLCLSLSDITGETLLEKELGHVFCPSVVSDINFFVNHMYRFCFLWVGITTQLHRGTHIHFSQKEFHACFMQLRLSCSPHDNQNSSSIAVDYWCCLTLIFRSSLRDQKLEFHSPCNLVGLLQAGDVFVKQFCTSQRLGRRALDSCWRQLLW